jgi:glucose-6-phosphate 1-dehydrogenase
LLLEVMRGNQNLFVRKDEIEAAWKWCDQLIAGWKNPVMRPSRMRPGPGADELDCTDHAGREVVVWRYLI